MRLNNSRNFLFFFKRFFASFSACSHGTVKTVQLWPTGDENGDPPGLYRPARRGNPNPTGWSLIGWNLWSQWHSEKIGVHPWIILPSLELQLQRTGDGNSDPSDRYRPAQCGNQLRVRLLWAGVGGPHSLGARRSSMFINHDLQTVTHLFIDYEAVVFHMDRHIYNLRLAQPNEKQ